jgi:hypothetical protein
MGGSTDMVAALGRAMATDTALMLMSLLLGLFLGMLWTGRSFPRRLPRRLRRDMDFLRR